MASSFDQLKRHAEGLAAKKRADELAAQQRAKTHAQAIEAWNDTVVSVIRTTVLELNAVYEQRGMYAPFDVTSTYVNRAKVSYGFGQKTIIEINRDDVGTVEVVATSNKNLRIKRFYVHTPADQFSGDWLREQLSAAALWIDEQARLA